MTMKRSRKKSDPSTVPGVRDCVAGADLGSTQHWVAGPPAALVILTELGLDLAAFPSEQQFVSWLRLAPWLAISAGRPVKKKPNGSGSNRVAGVLRLAAMSLSRSKTSLGASYRHIAFRKGAKIAIFATARKLATLVYRLLRCGQAYVDIGEKAYAARHQERGLRSLTASAKDLGFVLAPIERITREAVSSWIRESLRRRHCY